jgi:hypothetical protein
MPDIFNFETGQFADATARVQCGKGEIAKGWRAMRKEPSAFVPVQEEQSWRVDHRDAFQTTNGHV